MAAAAGDFDDDGFDDVFLANYGPNRLFRNRGDGTFADVAEEAGLAGPATLNGFVKWSVGPARRIRRLTVRWPSGAEQSWTGIEAGA